VRLAASPPRLLIASTMLPGRPRNDPLDLVIAATGRALGYTIITRIDALCPCRAHRGDRC
jgi:hypothetical protein